MRSILECAIMITSQHFPQTVAKAKSFFVNGNMFMISYTSYTWSHTDIPSQPRRRLEGIYGFVQLKDSLQSD